MGQPQSCFTLAVDDDDGGGDDRVLGNQQTMIRSEIKREREKRASASCSGPAAPTTPRLVFVLSLAPEIVGRPSSANLFSFLTTIAASR